MLASPLQPKLKLYAPPEYTYNDRARDHKAIRQLICLRRKPCSNNTSPVMAHHDKFGLLLQVLLPHAQYELGECFQELVRAIAGQVVATAVTREIDGDQDV